MRHIRRNYVVPNFAPTATDVMISGTPEAEETLTGSYTYGDTEGDLEGTSVLQWYLDDVAIEGENSDTYVLVEADNGHDVAYGVTPVALTGTAFGAEVRSAALAVLGYSMNFSFAANSMYLAV